MDTNREEKMKKERIFKKVIVMLERVNNEKMPNMHPFFHYVEIGGEGIGMNKWNIQSGISADLPDNESVMKYYDSIKRPYRQFAQKDLLGICEELNDYYCIDLTFFKSLWQAIYLFAAQGDAVNAEVVAEDFFSFVEWFKNEFRDSLDFPLSTPIFLGHAYSADIVGEHIESFFPNLKVRIASLSLFFPGSVKHHFTSFRYPDKQVTLLNAALTGATRRHTEYVARIGETNFHFHFRIGHTDCGNGFYLTLSYLPFGYQGENYSRAMRKPDTSPDIFCKCGGDYSVDGSFRIKNIQGGAQFRQGIPAEAPLIVRNNFLKSEKFSSLVKKIKDGGIQLRFNNPINDIAKFTPQDLNLFFVLRIDKPHTDRLVGKWCQQNKNALEKYGVRITSDDKLEKSLRDEDDPVPDHVGYRLSQDDIFSQYKETFGEISPFDLVVVKLMRIILCADGFPIDKSEHYKFREFRIAKAGINKWVGHSRGDAAQYVEMYDARARQFGFKEGKDWFNVSIDALSIEDIIGNMIKRESEAVRERVIAAINTTNFKLFHDSKSLNIQGNNFSCGKNYERR